MDRIFQINGFDGGESDDIVKGSANSFFAGENIDVRKNLSALKLSPKLEDTGWVFDDNISYMVNLETLGVSGGGVVVCLENGKIFLDGVLKQTINTGTNSYNTVISIGVNENLLGEQYIYYITKTTNSTGAGVLVGAGKIHRSTNNLATFDISYRDYAVSAGNNSFIGVINETGLLYIAINNKVFLMEPDEIVQEYLILPSQEKISGFTQFQGTYKIYTNSVNTGIQYIWDGVSEATSYRQEWLNQPIQGVVNAGPIDYAILGFSEDYSDLYIIPGTQKQELRVNLETASYSRVLGKYLTMREGLLYISGGKTGQSDNYGIYTYGNYYPGGKKSLVQSYSLSTDRFIHHAHGISFSYFANVDDKVYKISHNNPPTTYSDSGYVITHMYQGFLFEEKSFNYMKLGFKLNGGEIKVYARIEMNLVTETPFKLIKTIDNSTYGSKKSVRIDKNELMDNGVSLGTLNEIQLKFELIPSIGGGNTPELYSPTTWFTVTNNK